VLAVDPATEEVGAAGASCVDRQSIVFIYGAVPGVGAVVAQARFHMPSRDQALLLLEQGRGPEEILAAVARPEFDPGYQERQLAVVHLDGRAAAFTGAGTMPFASDRQGAVFSVQGNILTGPEVIDRAAEAFAAGAGCDLADRLMLGLEAGGAGGIGDRRCTGDGIPADSAFLAVDRAGEPAGSWLRLDVQSTNRGDDPVVRLRAAYDQWRALHPCVPAPPADGGLVDALGAADAGAVADAAASDAAAPDAVARDAGAAGEAPRGGCGCDAGYGARGGALIWTAWLVGWMARRRRAR
jgi:uncharacterized Ntn-hydrolase superfamily protein